MRSKEAGPITPSGHRWLYRLAGKLDVPQEVVLNLPKATLIGGLQVLVENHRGVIEYTPEKVRIATVRGELVVNGLRLKIGSILREEVVIEGVINSVHFLD